MADDDEIDIIGDFSFNSCFAQNDQGIPSCSNREDTVHPEWLLDSTATNWYDESNKDKYSGESSRKSQVNNLVSKLKVKNTKCNQSDREMSQKAVGKIGRSVNAMSQLVKTETIEAIHISFHTDNRLSVSHLDNHLPEKKHDLRNITSIAHVKVNSDDTNNLSNVLNMVSTGSPTVLIPRVALKKRNHNVRSKNSLLKPVDMDDKSMNPIDTSEIFYEDDLILGSTESIGSELDLSDIVSKNIVKYQAKVKAEKKIGNHRRKNSRSYEKKQRNKCKELLKSPQGRQRKDTSVSDESVKSPKMQIVLGSGQALPVSEGEQVIKIEKKKDSEPESDIDVDSDIEGNDRRRREEERSKAKLAEAPIAVPLRKFELMPKRQKRINLDGGGGYTIMHTDSGDLYTVGSEPRRERQRKHPIHLIQCRVYNAEKPAPYEVRLHVSTLIAMDMQAHTSRGEVMGLTGGLCAPARVLTVCAYRPAAAAADNTHCEMDAVSQAGAAESIARAGVSVCGWHHSHPLFPSAPSAVDLATQRYLQRALHWAQVPFLGFITSQHWPTGRTASQYRCIRVEDEDLETGTPIGYQFSVKLLPDLVTGNLGKFLQELHQITTEESSANDLGVDMANDICPQARITYLEKCISSVRHHMRSAGYADRDTIITDLVQGIREVFR